ncbi:MAG: prepilin-type N-terminal cleavage/methylation domain-containing protein [Candidatus Liptonbacteria bacterium]|nr:prepilin-type N-terminal cleavage/methylation domain-containing protein [Candidatus Liptonbacteria bacterium]
MPWLSPGYKSKLRLCLGYALASKLRAAARRGQSLVEVLVAAAVGALLVIAAAGVIAPALRANSTAGRVQVSAALAKELSDNIRVWSEGDWHNIFSLATSSANTYYLNTTSSPFTTSTGVEVITVATSTYSRYFFVDDVQRDSNGAAVSSGGSNDPSTKQVTVGYNWPQGVTTTFSFYVSRYRNNILDQTDWSGGSGQSSPLTSTRNLFASSTSIKFLTPGSIGVTMGSTGTLASWLTNTALPNNVYRNLSVVSGGYIYSIGGANLSNATATVLYAQVNTSTGVIGSWASTAALPSALQLHSTVVYNGYIYTIGGLSGDTADTSTPAVNYAQINANGTVGSWVATTALPGTLYYHSAVVNNGYIYVVGGVGSSAIPTSTVLYATLNANGTVGSWSITTALPVSNYRHAAVVYNGYVYVLGADTSTVLYATLNASGTVGSWVTTTALPALLTNVSAAVYNGYVYTVGGFDTVGDDATSTVFVAPLNANGTVGSWVTTAALPDAIMYHSVAAYKGYIYTMGGYQLTPSVTSTVFYAPIN